MRKICEVATVIVLVNIFLSINAAYSSGEIKSEGLLESDPSTLEIYITDYNKWRKVVTDKCGLPENASTEQIRPFISAYFNRGGENLTWYEIAKHPDLQNWLTEKNRKMFVRIFRMVPDAGWVMILEKAEEYWTLYRERLKKTQNSP